MFYISESIMCLRKPIISTRVIFKEHQEPLFIPRNRGKKIKNYHFLYKHKKLKLGKEEDTKNDIHESPGKGKGLKSSE